MCGNRVEELEARVKELEASVEGLTDELVECKVRLRELEDAVDEDLEFSPASTDAGSEPEVEVTGPDESESPEEAEVDTSNTEDADEEDNAETGTSDIIIA